MDSLKELYLLAEQCLDSRVDDALRIVEFFRSLPDEEIKKLGFLSVMVQKAYDVEYDESIVRNWPEQIINELNSFDPVFKYRSVDENWEVYSEYLSGNEEWKATVETETIAEILVLKLNKG